MSAGALVPIEFEMANKKMVAPGCGDLPVFHGEGHFISCWELTEEQLATIVDTKRIWLGIKAAGQPPVWISANYPFMHEDEWPEGIEKTTSGENDGKSNEKTG